MLCNWWFAGSIRNANGTSNASSTSDLLIRSVKPGFGLKINESEVVDAFEVPLAFLMNPENHQIHSKEFRGMERSYYAMPFAERYIWGATAGILRVLYERIYLA